MHDIFEALVRAVLMYLVGLVAIRVGKHRLLGRSTALDIILAFIMGSLLSRGINGNASPASCIVATATLIGLHTLFAKLAYRFDWFGWLIKGESLQLYGNGRFIESNLRKAAVSHKDVETELHVCGTETLEGVKALYLERNGEISVVKAEPRVLEVKVEAGVQTVRIQFE